LIDFTAKRKKLVEKLVREGILKSPEIIRAFLQVPREEFVLPEYRKMAYEDYPLPTLKNQTISAPHMCAIMCEALKIQKGNKILEVGAGSGYHAALCAEITAPSEDFSNGYVITIEYFPELASFAEANLKRAGYDDRVHVVVYDGSLGAPVKKNFDRILVTAAAPSIPTPLLDLLNAPGKLVIPVGSGFFQILTLVEKDENGNVRKTEMGGCVFVPLLGERGFRKDII